MTPANQIRLLAGAWLLWACITSTSLAQQRYMIEPADPSPAVAPHDQLVQDVLTAGGEIYVDVDFPASNGNLVGALLTLPQLQDLRQRRPDLIIVQDRLLEPAGGGGPVAWSPDRIDQRVGLDTLYNPPMLEECGEYRPFIYVCDTGVLGAHSEFASAGSRVALAGSYIAGLLPRTIPAWEDPWNHGTAVAACAIGELTGAGRCPANLVSAVCYPDPGALPGATFASYAADVIYWSLNEHRLRGFDDDPFNDASVLIFASSTTGGTSALLDLAIQRAYLGGMSVVVSAGNDNMDASTTSPAGAIDGLLGDITLTVAASTVADARWSLSNFGSRVELFAPGEGVLVASSLGPGVSNCHVVSGTSYSVGYAGGAAARLLAQNPWASPEEVKDVLTDPSGLTFGPSGAFGAGVNGVPRLLYVHPSEIECIPLEYGEWMNLNGANSDSPVDGDEDCDGLPNGIEYAMALDPLEIVDPEDRPEFSSDGNSASLRFRRADYLCDKVVFEAQWSTDLINWTAVPESSIVVDDDAPCFAGGSWVVAPIPVGGDRLFARLRVSGL